MLLSAVAATPCGQRNRGRVRLGAGGVLSGAAQLTRPFDAVLVLVPLIVFACVRGRGDPVRVLRVAASVAAGLLPFVALLLPTTRR